MVISTTPAVVMICSFAGQMWPAGRSLETLDLEQKIKTLNKYEGGRNLSSIAHELDFGYFYTGSILND
jgi:hypothetical protein